MAMAIAYGMGSGALHAVSGPDHLLSLGPVALARRARAGVVGLFWGMGHSVGTWLLALPLLLLSEFGAFPVATLLTEHGHRVGALALVVMGISSLRHTPTTTNSASSTLRSALLVGAVHGLTGAASLALVVPVVLTADMLHALMFLLMFGFGSTVAMGAITHGLGRAGNRVPPVWIVRTQKALSWASIAAGAVWMVS